MTALVGTDSFNETRILQFLHSFIDMNNCTEEIGIDYATDFVDEMHMNWIGQQKLSNYIGNLISGNYEFEDKRNDSEYSQWNDDFDTMMYYINNFDVLYGESGV